MSSPHSEQRVETLVEKAEYMETCLEILASKQSISREAYVDDVETRDIVERRFEKLTGAALDIARMLLKDIDGKAPNSNAAAMEDSTTLGYSPSRSLTRWPRPHCSETCWPTSTEMSSITTPCTERCKTSNGIDASSTKYETTWTLLVRCRVL